MVIVDTTVWIDYFANRTTGQTSWLDREMDRQPIGLTDLILCEVLQGFRRDDQFRRVRRELRNFVLFDSGGEAVAEASAHNYRLLRAKGITIRKTIDCVIATFCLLEGHALLHGDRDFDHFEEHFSLPVIHPHAGRATLPKPQ